MFRSAEIEPLLEMTMLAGVATSKRPAGNRDDGGPWISERDSEIQG